MTIDARIVTVSVREEGIYLVLEPGQALLITHITHHTRIPLVGQRITGDIGHVVVEGGDGECIMYSRQGSFLREQAE